MMSRFQDLITDDFISDVSGYLFEFVEDFTDRWVGENSKPVSWGTSDADRSFHGTIEDCRVSNDRQWLIIKRTAYSRYYSGFDYEADNLKQLGQWDFYDCYNSSRASEFIDRECSGSEDDRIEELTSSSD